MMTTTAGSASSAQTQVLTFHLAGEEYGVDILRVREVIEYVTVTAVPAAPDAIRGVINLRGSVIPVVDLARLFGMATRPVTRRSCVVMVEVQHAGRPRVLGVIADAVSRVMELEPGGVIPAPEFGTRARQEFLRGMAPVEDRFVLILDIDRTLTAENLLIDRSMPLGDSAAGVPALVAQ